jgi:hypothetical protein
LNLLQHFLGKLARESSAPYLFAQPPRLDFRTTLGHCPVCQAPLKVKKTRIKTVSTLHLGGFRARETLLYCDRCPHSKLYASEELRSLVPPGGTLGYDVMTFIGRALFLRHRRAPEIVEELRTRNVHLSASAVAHLGKRFVVYLARAHRQSAPRLQDAMRDQGGYILHLDGTCEGSGPMLMSSLDSISEIVLGNLKVPSEKATEIIPLLREIRSRYGVPLALVHDMGTGILAAVKEVFAGVPDFICHFHFLRDAGKDLLEADYDAIRKRLRHHAITEKLLYQARQLKPLIDQEPSLLEGFGQSIQTGSLPLAAAERFPWLGAYSLIQWVLEGKTQGQGYGFPFDRPQLDFAQRLLALSRALEPIKDLHLRGQWRDNIPLFKLSHPLREIAADQDLEKVLAAIQPKIQAFDRLRAAMRLAETDGSAGLNSGSAPLAMGPIQKAVQEFHHQITSHPDYPTTRHWKNLIHQIDKYADKLFADPITVHTPHGPLQIQPQRTNNIMERFFRDLRRGVRRKTGHNSLSAFLQSMIADTPLVRNLENPRYLEILLDGQPSLEACFARIDTQTVRKDMLTAAHWPDRVPGILRKLIAAPAFPTTFCGMFSKPLAANSN